MKAYIIYSTYELIENKTIIQLFGRLENGQSFVSVNNLEPYFFIKSSDKKKAQPLLNKFKVYETKLTTFQGNEVIKIAGEDYLELNKLSSALHKLEIDTFEADIKPNTRFLLDNNILTSINIEGDFQSSEKVDRIYQHPEIKAIEYTPSNLKVLSIDTESGSQGELFCIGLYSNNYKKTFIISAQKFKDTTSAKSEADCLEEFKKELIKFDPDIITGWNMIDHDLALLQDLFKKHKIQFDLGRTNANARLRIENNFFKASSADIAGRQVLDALSLIRDPFIKEAPSIKYAQFESNTLEDVSQAILGSGKLIKGKNRHAEIIQLFLDNQQKLIDYNIQDCKLVYDILEKTKIIDLAIERSQLTGMELDRITASIAAFDSLYIREARNRGLVSPTTRYQEKESKIIGGYVKSPEPGVYKNVIVLDFKSLYPSVIRTFNIDPASFLEKKEPGSIESPNHAFFKNQPGILPMIIEKLHAAREKAKKEKREFATYAIKIIQNGFYGVLASPNCRYYNFNLAGSVTNFAQMVIKMTAEEIEKKGHKVIYSDSVDGKTKVIIKKEGRISEEFIQDLFINKDQESIGKEYNFKDSIEVLTLDNEGKSVFKPIKYVMRHKADKKMYRVHFTNNWHIDVTEDHSLIGYQSLAFNNKKSNLLNPLNRLIELKPLDIGKKANTIISLKKIPYKYFNKNNKYPKEVYEFMGYFIGDGSFQRNRFYKIHKKDYYLHLSLGIDQEEVINKLIMPLKEQGYIKNYWLSKTRKGDIAINGLKIVKLISGSFSDIDGKKIIPKWLFEENEENIASFLRGLFSADGCVMIRNKAPIIKYTSIYDLYIEDIRRLLYRVGISHSVFKENSVNRYKSKDKVYTSGSYSKNITIQNKDIFADKIGFILDRKNKLASIRTNGTQKRHIKKYEFDIQGVMKVEEIETPDYVYDIEVDDLHRFFANYVLVHNTDSVFLESNLNKEKSSQLGKDLQDYINNYYQDFIKKEYNRHSYLELEFKKLYIAMMFPQVRNQQAKAKSIEAKEKKAKETEEEKPEVKGKGARKRYAGLVEIDGKEELEVTGLEAIRGDWTDAAQEFQKELLMKLFHSEPIDKFIKEYVKKIRAGKMDEKLVYRKSIRKDLAEYTKTTPPHVKAARLLDKLDGTVISYLMTEAGPEPIQKLKHKIDYDHYIKKQIEPIANQILSLLKKDFSEIQSSSKQNKLF